MAPDPTTYPAPPQVNARVVALTDDDAATGGRDDWDTPGVDPAGGGAEKWTGEARGYFTVDEDRVQSVGGVDLAEARVFIVCTEWARAVELDRGDTLTIETDDGQTVSGRARLIMPRALGGIPAALQTTRVLLEVT